MLRMRRECLPALQVPEFRVSYTITTDKFDALYKRLKPKGVTLTALLAKAAGVALASHPLLYAGLRRPPSAQRPTTLPYDAACVVLILYVPEQLPVVACSLPAPAWPADI